MNKVFNFKELKKTKEFHLTDLFSDYTSFGQLFGFVANHFNVRAKRDGFQRIDYIYFDNSNLILDCIHEFS